MVTIQSEHLLHLGDLALESLSASISETKERIRTKRLKNSAYQVSVRRQHKCVVYDNVARKKFHREAVGTQIGLQGS